ncbi:MAG: hypothetical protein WDW38_000703 [Sanguina aurantia]
MEEVTGQGTALGVREYARSEVHSWVVRLQQLPGSTPANFLEGCGIGLDVYGYFYVNGRYFHASNLANWLAVAKPVRGSTAKHKGKSCPCIVFGADGSAEVLLTLDLREGTLAFAHGGRSIGTIAAVSGPLHAAVTLTSSRQTATLAPGPVGRSEHTNEELVYILKAKGCIISRKLEAALAAIPRDLFVPRDRHREAFRDQKVTVRLADGSTMTLPPPSFVAAALERLCLGPSSSFLDVGCGTAYVTALAAVLVGPTGSVHGIECVSSRLEAARANVRQLKLRIAMRDAALLTGPDAIADPLASLNSMELTLSNVLMPECTDGATYDALYCDASLSEEDLPTFLSLLKPGGKMVVVIEEDALLVVRGTGGDPQDFTREVITRVSGDFGELDDPTPWEVQEALLRMKGRERRRGLEQARSDIASLRSFEFSEMQQRVAVAMARIAELEAALQRSGVASDVGPLRSPVQPAQTGFGGGGGITVSIPSSPLGPGRRSGTPGGVDDILRGSGRDKGRRGVLQGKRSPDTRPELAEAWRESGGRAGGERESAAKNRAKELFEDDQIRADRDDVEAAAAVPMPDLEPFFTQASIPALLCRCHPGAPT